MAKCLTAQDLFVFTQGRQGIETASQVAIHLAICSQCDAFVDGLLAEEQRRFPDLQPPPGHEPVTDEEAALGLAAIKLMTGGLISDN